MPSQLRRSYQGNEKRKTERNKQKEFLTFIQLGAFFTLTNQANTHTNKQTNTIPTGEEREIPVGVEMKLVNDGWFLTENKDNYVTSLPIHTSTGRATAKLAFNEWSVQ